MSDSADRPGVCSLIRGDLRRKAQWVYKSDRAKDVLKVLFSDGTAAMVLYRIMQWSRRYRLAPLELLLNKFIAIFCHCVIGRGVEFGPGLVFVHSNGLFINGKVRGGRNVTLYHQVTLGGEGNRVPILGDEVLVAAGAKVIGKVRLGDGCRVAANSVVFAHVPAGVTVMGIPAMPLMHSSPAPAAPREPNADPE